MMRLKWKTGPLGSQEGPYFVSATRFTYQRYQSMPFVFWHGHRLRRSWPHVEGAVGLSIMVDIKTRTTYTVSAWLSADDLYRWVRSPGHARLMRSYRPRLSSSAADNWQSPTLDLREFWR